MKVFGLSTFISVCVPYLLNNTLGNMQFLINIKTNQEQCILSIPLVWSLLYNFLNGVIIQTVVLRNVSLNRRVFFLQKCILGVLHCSYDVFSLDSVSLFYCNLQTPFFQWYNTGYDFSLVTNLSYKNHLGQIKFDIC